VSLPSDYDDLAQALAAHDGRPGYGQVVVLPEQDEIVLFWKGDLPSDVAELVADSRVLLVRARFSGIEIRDASRRVFEEALAQHGPGVVGAITGARDLTGLVVHTTRPLDLEPLERAAGMPLRQEIGRAVRLAGLPRE
jgi:hypothetical protein